MNFLQWIQQLNFSYIIQLCISALAAMLCISIHESAHGLVALWLGDSTAKKMGRISLNPLRHWDFKGFIMLALVHVGWAKPVPIDSRNFHNPKLGVVLTAFAGPISNFLLAVITGYFSMSAYIIYANYRTTAFVYYIFLFFYLTTLTSIGLAVFNLIPISPLDGSKVLFAFLPKNLYWKLMRFERYGMILLVVLVFFGAFDGFLSNSVEYLARCVMEITFPIAKFVVQIFL